LGASTSTGAHFKMTEPRTDEEYYDDQDYYGEYYDQVPRRGWSSLALAISGLAGIVVGFACAACIGLALVLLLPPVAGTEQPGQVVQTAQEWADMFRAAGLEIENQQDLADVGGELLPGVLSGVQFDMPSYCDACGGKIIVFQSQEYVVPMADWLKGLWQYVYSKGTVLVQIDQEVPENVARQYETVLMEQ
jgi:hypothetical protein